MCGFAGVVQVGGGTDVSAVELMAESLAHRGPDGAGRYSTDGPLGITLACRRLAILDLTSAGDQPMRTRDDRYCIAYNGELYNDGELRSDLRSRGYTFQSGSDTETVLEAYAEYGTDCFQKMNAMFALAIVDRPRETIVLARDRMGIKPLYYAYSGRRLLFASELRALVWYGGVGRSIDPDALELYLALGYVPAPHSLVRGVRKLPAGSWLSLGADGVLHIDYFWRPTYPQPLRLSHSNAARRVQQTIDGAVRRQLRSDVPMGVMLSGGVDSTIIATEAAQKRSEPVHTFTISFRGQSSQGDPRLDEDVACARLVAQQLHTQHHEVVVDDGLDLEGLLRDLAVALDEPVWEASFINIHVISERARRCGVKVLLTGDGSDELFAGYPWISAAWRQQQYERVPGVRRAAALLARALPADTRLGRHALNASHVLGLSDTDRYEWSHTIFPPTERRALMGRGESQVGEPDALVAILGALGAGSLGRHLPDRIAMLDLALWVREHFNQRLDRMTMRNSVEARVPFQDDTVVDLALALPFETKARFGRSKQLLKAAYRGRIPDYVLTRRKRPFAAPMSIWIEGRLRRFIREVLDPERVDSTGVLDAGVVSRVVDRMDPRRDRELGQVWALMMFQLWADGLMNPIYSGRRRFGAS